MRLRPLILTIAVFVMAASIPARALALEPDIQIAGEARLAAAAFQTYDASGCITTFASVFVFSSVGHAALEEQIHLDPNEAGLDLVIAQYELCHGWPTPLWITHGDALIYRPAFWWDGNGLSSATLTTPISVCDIDLLTNDCIARSNRTVDVNLTWTGVGDVERFHSFYRSLDLPYHVNVFGETGAARNADVSGAILDGATDYAAGLAGTGYVASGTRVQLSVPLGPPAGLRETEG